MKPYLYIDTDFFEYLLNYLNKGVFSEDFDSLNNIRKFIFHPNVNVVLDYEKMSENNLLNDFIRVKGAKALENNGSTSFEAKDSSGFENEVIKIGSKSPFSICFSSKGNVPLKDFVQKSGYYFIDPDSITDFISLPFVSGKNVFGISKAGDIRSWKDLKMISHNFNTLIILDRFLFSKNRKATHSTYKETVSEIVGNLMHKNTSEEIDVMLVSVKNLNSDVGLNLKEIKESIEQELKTKNITAKINISIARCKQITDNNHDRLIFTNFCAMFSGNSFNYFENKTIKSKAPAINTALTVYSIIDFDNWNGYSQMLKARKKELPIIDDLNIPNEDLREGNIEIDFLKFI